MFVEPLSASLPPGPVWGALAGSDRHRQMDTGKNPGPHAMGGDSGNKLHKLRRLFPICQAAVWVFET